MNEQVVTAGTRMDNLEHLFGERAEKVWLDFTDETSFHAALNGIDRVLRPDENGRNSVSGEGSHRRIF